MGPHWSTVRVLGFHLLHMWLKLSTIYNKFQNPSVDQRPENQFGHGQHKPYSRLSDQYKILGERKSKDALTSQNSRWQEQLQPLQINQTSLLVLSEFQHSIIIRWWKLIPNQYLASVGRFVDEIQQLELLSKCIF